MFSAMNKDEILSLQDCMKHKKQKKKERRSSGPGAWRRRTA
jgi:hypothetical protein